MTLVHACCKVCWATAAGPLSSSLSSPERWIDTRLDAGVWKHRFLNQSRALIAGDAWPKALDHEHFNAGVLSLEPSMIDFENLMSGYQNHTMYKNQGAAEQVGPSSPPSSLQTLHTDSTSA